MFFVDFHHPWKEFRGDDFHRPRIVLNLGLRVGLRVRDAVDNCDSAQRRKRLRSSRRAFIADAVRKGYSLFQDVERARMPGAAERLHAVVAAIATPEEAQRLTAAYGSALGAMRRGVVTLAHLETLPPSALLERLLDCARH